MPTYEYKCSECDHHFERFQSIKEDPVKKCPKCGGKVERLISRGAGIIFKGSGFYETDYRSDNYKKAEKREKSSETSSSDSKKSESEDQKSSSESKKKQESTTT